MRPQNHQLLKSKYVKIVLAILLLVVVGRIVIMTNILANKTNYFGIVVNLYSTPFLIIFVVLFVRWMIKKPKTENNNVISNDISMTADGDNRYTGGTTILYAAFATIIIFFVFGFAVRNINNAGFVAIMLLPVLFLSFLVIIWFFVKTIMWGGGLPTNTRKIRLIVSSLGLIILLIFIVWFVAAQNTNY